ncbi:hypothetical protein B0O80DRAFT_498333 [Mortierella sp. GBAus27b]|nr:hypothetical protein BGX31_007443 [Mortierella sp. GBA43]KAI8354320.1 hypothetical protein B0O80DRAFT_498333 [Mortierella sp. GBAus27b]
MAAHDHHTQAFRARASHETTTIPSRLDTKTGLRIVLWKDIQQFFKQAERILNGDQAVLFVTDDNFEYLSPLRIAHYPGVVLDVVVANMSDNISTDASGQAIESVSGTASPQRPGTLGQETASSVDEPSYTGRYPASDSETTYGPIDHIRAGHVNALVYVESALPLESRSISDNATPADESPLMETNIPSLEIPGSSDEHIQATCDGTADDGGSFSEIGNDPHNSNNNNNGDQPCALGEMLVIHSGSATIYTHSSIQAYHQLHSSYLEARNSGLYLQAATIEHAMNELLQRLEAEMDKIRAIKAQITEPRKFSLVNSDMEEHMDKVEDEKQQECVRMQQPRLEVGYEGDRQQQQNQGLHDPLPHIQDSILAMVNHNYELREYPFPRLFVVLPREVHGPDVILKPIPKQFRLYFLCECGAHTMPEKCTTPHHVHLANHRGYDIIKPVEFFQKYGWYVLAQMYMIKHGVSAAGLIVPSLKSLGVIEGLSAAQEHLDCVKENMESLVNESIEFLRGLAGNRTGCITTDDDAMKLNKIEIMEGADRGSLKRYLRVEDEDRGYGGLYRIVTLMGYVKWVCKDHYIAKDPTSITPTLQPVRREDSSYIWDAREITLSAGSQFGGLYSYIGASTSVSRIQKLRITLTSTSDYALRNVASAAIDVGVVDLAMDGYNCNWNKVYGDHIVEITSHGRLQSLRFLSSYQQVDIINTSSFTNAPKMRDLELQCPVNIENNAGMSFLERIFSCCPNLVYLGLRLMEQVSLVKVIMVAVSSLKKLERLEVYYGNSYASADITFGEFRTLLMNMPFTKHCIFKNTTIPRFPQVLDETLALDQLIEILHKVPEIDSVKFGYCELEPRDVLDKLGKQHTEPGCNDLLLSRRLELFYIQDRVIVSSSSVFMEYVQRGAEADVRFNQDMGDSAMCTNSNGWSIMTLEVVSGIVNDGFARLLDKSTENEGSRLRSLGFDINVLSAGGLRSLDNVIRRSKGVESLSMICTASGVQFERENAQWFLEHHGRALTKLCIHASSPDELKKWFEHVFPTKEVLPGLNDLQLTLIGFPIPPQPSPYIQWLVEMISTPSYAMSMDAGSNASQSLSNDSSKKGSSLKRLSLNGATLIQTDWARVIEAIDFTALEELELKDTNFSRDTFDKLTKYIGNMDAAGPLPLGTLDLSDTKLGNLDDELLGILESFRDKATHAVIHGL